MVFSRINGAYVGSVDPTYGGFQPDGTDSYYDCVYIRRPEGCIVAMYRIEVYVVCPD